MLPGESRGQETRIEAGKCFTFSTIVDTDSIFCSVFKMDNAFIWFKDLSCFFCIIPEFLCIQRKNPIIYDAPFTQKFAYYLYMLLTFYFFHFTYCEDLYQCIESILILFYFYSHIEFHFMDIP